MQQIKIDIPSFTEILNEAKKLNPGINDLMSIRNYCNHLYSISRHATTRERRIAAAEKLIKAAELFELYYTRRN